MIIAFSQRHNNPFSLPGTISPCVSLIASSSPRPAGEALRRILMKCSTDRILTTHAGSLPRPAVLTQAIVGHDRGTLGPDEAGALPTQIRDAVATIAKSQAEAGVDIMNDGEASKIGYSTYVRERLSGFSGKGRGLTIWDLHDVPEFAQRSLAGLDPQTPACTGPIVIKVAPLWRKILSICERQPRNWRRLSFS
jgi:hypothetical protein